MPQKNDLVTIEITDMAHTGSGIGHLDGMAVFVPGTAVGDKLTVRLVKIAKMFCFGRMEQVLQPSPDRIDPVCPVSHRCGGCAFRHISYAAELRHKQAFVQNNLLRIGRIDLSAEPIIPSPRQEGYRNKAQYPVRMQNGKLCAGFFATRSHEVIHCPDCKLQPGVFTDILNTLLAFCEARKISVYDESTQKGLLRHIYLRKGEQSGEVMVCLVINGTAFPNAHQLVKQLRISHPQIVSVLLNINQENTNVILGRRTKLLYGKPAIRDRLSNIEVDLSPSAFYQVNSLAAEQLYALVGEFAALTGKEILLDLYCGVGTIGLALASQCKQVIGVEIIPQAVENAKNNASRNKIENARFLCADAAQAAAQFRQDGIAPDVVILDPPRKGCDPLLLQTVAEMNPLRIVMVSCDSATMARDCALLGTLGYVARRCRPIDLFPHTVHVESVVLMSRVDK